MRSPCAGGSPARANGVLVIARNSSFTYKRRAVHLQQIADELGVRYVLEGSVRKGGDRVRITAQLNDVATGSHLRAERYDRGLADVFAVQDEIAEAIVAAIEPQLYAAENFRAQRKQPDSLDAWDLVMRALSHYWRITRQDNIVAQALLEKAIRIDPQYGQALGVLATSYMFCAHMGSQALPRRPAPRRARLAPDPDPCRRGAGGYRPEGARRPRPRGGPVGQLLVWVLEENATGAVHGDLCSPSGIPSPVSGTRRRARSVRVTSGPAGTSGRR